MGFSLSITEIATRRMHPWQVKVDPHEAGCSASLYAPGNPAGLHRERSYAAAVVRPENKIH